ncbi:MAG: nucleotidyltransferase domain-containing protein [Ignavibacteriae bacterium]|nr:nucleotidyltransferase domain-containing protein [Ignavibacteriota bacterium]
MDKNVPLEIQQLIAHYRPERVILFGSHATGTARGDSDYDFLIIKETATRRLNRREEAMRNIRQSVALDLLILTPSEVQFLRDIKSQFIEEIFEYGTLIYERN